MLGFVIGTVCVIGLVKLARARRRWYMAACGGGPGPGMWRHGHHGWHGGLHGGRGGMMRMLYQYLDTSPGQEKVIRGAVEEVTAAARAARGEVDLSRGDLARAITAPSFDAELLGQTFVRHDDALGNVRRAFVGALARVHEALDEKQRQRLAELVEHGPGWRFAAWSGHPYR